ncbi:MAG: SMC-Scp complex subunit ScpB [Bdellovibrionales bacterium]
MTELEPSFLPEAPDMLHRQIEAILFAQAEPMSIEALSKALPEGADIANALEALRSHYAPRGIRLVETGGLWSFRTAPDMVASLHFLRQPRRKLPRAASEVLAIIAYHQPVTRAEIEGVRGVETSKGTLDLLLELGWVRPGKRRETPGRPLTWHTTQEFLSYFNLQSLKDLPGMDELKAAGLLDTRLVLTQLSRDGEDVASSQSSRSLEEAAEDEDYAAWAEDSVGVGDVERK